ncbi:gas vesicle protein [Amycolatopsis taiwanensis]|uniref:Gas vesicle protein GvpJ 1 n=1 Tax=Amycolatopsis taiwanensis TaxID=342230 RepID=A0A9W6QWQ9_9PSEU|nr:gas vesicle protein [Amycolatopsis taiwanensis]GLY65133.1 putative gas vesicle protein GvpJ 1 [Amycolatopsis taiwanensis]
MSSIQPANSGRSGALTGGGHQPANLGDILERVLDKGLVIAGDIQVNLLDIELLTIKLRLVIASLETAKEVGINWWENDPWLTGDGGKLQLENEKLRARIAELEGEQAPRQRIEGGGDE